MFMSGRKFAFALLALTLPVPAPAQTPVTVERDVIFIRTLGSAIRWVHAHADEYGIDPDRIYLIGNSSGGHL